jgi:hypothetical protein
MTQKDASAILSKVLTLLGEHFDDVRIIVAWHEDGMPNTCTAGAGNVYAQRELARAWLRGNDHEDLAGYIGEVVAAIMAEPEEPDEGESYKTT